MLIVGSIVGLIIATALIAREQAQTAKNLELARRAIEDYLTKVSESRLLDEPGLQPLRKELLESALKYYQGLMSERRATAVCAPIWARLTRAWGPSKACLASTQNL